MRVALLGTRGVPARYGGFETCVEQVGWRLAARGHEVLVYCRTSTKDPSPPSSYRGMSLVHRPAARCRSLETLSHTALSVAHATRAKLDAAILFNSANSPLLPALRASGVPVATHVDGLEWRRAKWGNAGQHYYRRAESLAVRWSDALIADAPGIADYYKTVFGADTAQIAYGAPLIGRANDRLGELGLLAGGYHLVVARFEPENHLDLIVAGYTASSASLPLVVVGSAPYAAGYTRDVRELAGARTRFVGAVWDQDLLDQLYANAATYVHGHSVGGTNPSLLRALGAGAPAIAFDVVFNRDVLGSDGVYFRTPTSLAGALEDAERDRSDTVARGERLRRRAQRYDWDDVADDYERLLVGLVESGLARHRPSGRRFVEWDPGVTPDEVTA